MTTRLLDPKEIRAQNGQDLEDRMSRINALSVEEKRLVKSVNILKSSHVALASTVDSEHKVATAKRRSEIKEMENEVISLEGRRQAALAVVDSMNAETQKQFEEIAKREEAISVNTEKNATREADIIVRENTITEQEKKYAKRIRDISKREEQATIKETSLTSERAALNDLEKDFAKEKSLHFKYIATREQAIAFREKEVERMLKDGWNNIAHAKDEVDIEWKKIQHSQQILKAAFDEARKKGII